MRSRLIPGRPVGHVTEHDFATGAETARPMFTASAEALRFRCRRAELNLTPEAAARRLGIKAVDLLELEFGEKVPVDPNEWPRLIAALEVQHG